MVLHKIFNKKDNKYYEFKTEIKTKENLREILKLENEDIVFQFERWWDKYQKSFKKINQDIDEVEKKMWNYLKELNYD